MTAGSRSTPIPSSVRSGRLPSIARMRCLPVTIWVPKTGPFSPRSSKPASCAASTPRLTSPTCLASSSTAGRTAASPNSPPGLGKQLAPPPTAPPRERPQRPEAEAMSIKQAKSRCPRSSAYDVAERATLRPVLQPEGLAGVGEGELLHHRERLVVEVVLAVPQFVAVGERAGDVVEPRPHRRAIDVAGADGVGDYEIIAGRGRRGGQRRLRLIRRAGGGGR